MTVSLAKTYKEHVFNTAEELDYWLAHPDQFLLPQLFEVVEGKIVETMATKAKHGLTAGKIGYLLGAVVYPNKSGKIGTAEMGFELQKEPLTLRCPDVSFIRAERLGDETDDSFIVGAPDLAVEVLSPGNTLAEMIEKARQYLAGGAKLVWLVNTKSKEVEVWRQDSDEVEVLKNDDEITGEEAISGFKCKVSEFFE